MAHGAQAVRSRPRFEDAASRTRALVRRVSTLQVGPAHPFDASDVRTAALVACALLASFVVVQRGQVASFDGGIMLNVAQRLVSHHTLTVDPRVDTLGIQHPYTSYGFGTSLFLVPFVIAQNAISRGAQTITTLANPVLLAATGGLLVLVGIRLSWDRRVAVLVGLGFGLLTPALFQSTEGFSEPGVAFGATLAVLGILVWRSAPVGALLTGSGIGIAILWRPDSIVLVAPFLLGAAWLTVPARKRRPRTLAWCVFPIAAVLVFQLWYDSHRYGSMFDTGMSQQARGQGFTTPLLHGLDLLLRSPGRGFFWTAPVLILALPGFLFLWRRERVLTVAIAALALARLLFYAKWWIPEAGVGWGPRFLFALTPLLAVPAGAFADGVLRAWPPARRRVVWIAVGVLAALSGAISLLSVVVPYEAYWNAWVGDAKPALRVARAHSYFWSIRHSPIAGNLHMLGASHKRSLIHFTPMPDLVAVVAVVIALVAAGFAFQPRLRKEPREARSTGSDAPSET